MLERQRRFGSRTAWVVWLELATLTACSGANTSSINRDIQTADGGSDAGPAEVERDAAEEGGASDPARQEADASALIDAAPTALDAAPTALDAALTAMDAISGEVDAGVDAGLVVDAAPMEAATPQDASRFDANEAAADTSLAADDAAPEAAVSPGATAPTKYLKPADSPFAGVTFDYFYLEDFEDHTLSTPGLSSVTGPGSSTLAGTLSSSFGPGLIDSVDADDGTPSDDRCIKLDAYCDAWWGPGALTFAFDAQVLGSLPTHVGGVWTDGEGVVSFEAFGPDGSSVYKVGPLSEPGFPDSTVNSSTSEDRFFGAYHPAGISAFTISNTAGGVEVDHVQYGRAR